MKSEVAVPTVQQTSTIRLTRFDDAKESLLDDETAKVQELAAQLKAQLSKATKDLAVSFNCALKRLEEVNTTTSNSCKLLEDKVADVQHYVHSLAKDLRHDSNEISAEVDKLANERRVLTEEAKAANEALDAKKKAILQVTAQQEGKVKLNIGGCRYDVSVSTLCSQPGSLFERLFNGGWSVKPSEDGRIFIDRDGTHYRHIFNFLRDGESAVLPIAAPARHALKKEAEFLGLPGLVGMLDKLAAADRPTLPDGWRFRTSSDFSNVCCMKKGCGYYCQATQIDQVTIFKCARGCNIFFVGLEKTPQLPAQVLAPVTPEALAQVPQPLPFFFGYDTDDE